MLARREGGREGILAQPRQQKVWKVFNQSIMLSVVILRRRRGVVVVVFVI